MFFHLFGKGRQCRPDDPHEIGEPCFIWAGPLAVFLFGNIVMCRALDVVKVAAEGEGVQIPHLPDPFKQIGVRCPKWAPLPCRHRRRENGAILSGKTA